MSSPADTDTSVDPATGEPEEKVRLNLDVSVQSPSACQRHVMVTVSRPDIERYLAEEFDKITPEAQVPGFRPGRAPRKLVESHFRKDVAKQIKGRIILDCVTQVTEDQQFTTISEPDFDFEAIDVPEEGPMTFEFDIEVRPEFELPQWKGLKLERPTMTVGRAEIDQHVQRLLERVGTLEPVDEPARRDDYVTVSIVFSLHGKKVRAAESLNVRVRPVLSFRDGNLDGFEKLMVGAKSGDRRTAQVTLSREAESADLRGETLDLDIEVLEVKRVRLPEVNEELLSRLGNFGDEGELRDAVKEELERQVGYRQNERIRQQITSLLTEAATWELPPDLLKRQSQRELERAIMELRSSGFSDDEIAVHVNALRQNSQRSTARAMKEHFILERIAEENQIEANDEEYDLQIEMMAMQSRESSRSVRARIEKRGLWDALRNQIIERKVVWLIKENASFVDIPLPPTDQSTTAVDFAIGRTVAADIPDAKHGGDEQPLKLPTDRT